MPKQNTAARLMTHIRSGMRVFVHGGAATPTALVSALIEESARLENVELIHLHTEGDAAYALPKYKKNFRVVNLFVGANVRSLIDTERVDYLPIFLSEIPALFHSGRRPIDVAMLHLSPPDQHGFCSLGTSVDVARAAFDSANVVIAQINAQMPRVHGDGFIHIDELDDHIEIDTPLFEPKIPPLTDQDKGIAANVSGLIEDGACLQVGIGAIPNAVLQLLKGRKNLGVHTEMWSDGMLNLIESGAVDNSQKSVHPGKTVSGFILGSRKVYDYIHDNPSVVQLGIDYINNPNVISRNSKVTAINSAVEIDLTGQVCADSVGSRIISGVGGQMDFMRGAALSRGGKPIIAMRSRTKMATPRIVPVLKNGAGVVSTRPHVHYVVTEYGTADLYGKTLGERANALIKIAHPEDRESLARGWHNLISKGEQP